MCIRDRYIIRDILLINSAGNSFIESKQKAFTFAVNPSCVSKALGHKKSNVEYFRKMGVDIRIIGDKEIPKYQCEMKAVSYTHLVHGACQGFA